MVIKDVLKKLNSSDPNDPKVQELRKKLAKIKEQQKSQKNSSGDNKPVAKASQQNKKNPLEKKESSKDELEVLAKASEKEQRAFAQQQDPNLKVREERTHKLVAKQVGELIELATEMGKRLTTLEQEKSQTTQHIEKIQKRNEELEEKMKIIDGRLEKFMSLYEIITNQYNPFSEKQEAQSSQPSSQTASDSGQKVQLTDELTGKREDVEFKQGQISNENKQKIDQLLRELESDEHDEEELTLEQQDEVQEKQHEIADQLKGELHGLFSSFEERMKSHVQDTVQDRLHEVFAGLEESLEHEVDEAIEEDITSLKKDEDIIEGALRELAQLEADATDAEAFGEDEKQLEETVHSIDDQIRAIPPSLYFRLHDGRILKSIDDLKEALSDMDDSAFAHHVNDGHNDFADWLALALKDPRGEQLRGKSREEMVDLL